MTGIDAHGFQIWINHREDDRWVAPRAMHAMAADIPEVHDTGAIVRVLHGAFAGLAPAYPMVTPVTLLHARLEAGAAGAECMFASGTPIGEPIVHGGPFVMTTAAQMTEKKRRYARGEMGVLAPLGPG